MTTRTTAAAFASSTASAPLGQRAGAQIAAAALAALMTFGTLGSVHTLAASEASQGLLAQAHASAPRA
jgi:hypothetical protein